MEYKIFASLCSDHAYHGRAGLLILWILINPYNFQQIKQYSMLMLNNTICSNVWKSSLVLCLLKRAKSICYSHHLFEVEIGKLKRLFYDNNYPAWFFDKIYNKFKAKLDDIPVDEIPVDEISVVNNLELLYVLFLFRMLVKRQSVL